ncbi:MAG: hypothetical protein ABEJ73_11140 [Haloplanus sp.]
MGERRNQIERRRSRRHAAIRGGGVISNPDAWETTAPIRVLHVADPPDFAELVALYLEREGASLGVLTEHSGAAALDRLDTTTVDCLVSDRCPRWPASNCSEPSGRPTPTVRSSSVPARGARRL